jgi:acetyl-CoA acetyltransferase
MSEAFIIGVYSTAFGRMPERGFKDLTREAYLGVLADGGLDDGSDIAAAWFGNCGMASWGQGNIRGQVCFTPLVREGLFPERVPLVNVEGACATASLALQGAWKDVRLGDSELALAIGVEKTFVPDDPARMMELFRNGIDQLDPEDWEGYYRAAGEAAGKPFEPGPDRTIFMDTYAMQACYHMRRYGTTQAQIAAGAAKNHTYGALNPKAQYRFAMTVEQVLADRPVTYPFTRAMCAPIGDGAAAALVCGERYLRGLPAAVRERSVKIAAISVAGGKYRALDEPSLSRVAGDQAYARAGVGPDDIDVAEVHDATAFCELYQAEMLRFCSEGQGGPFVASGATGPGGRLPTNTSGGLVSKGHPVGATGLSMTAELVTQLRGEAGERQVPGARRALQENGGGVMGFDEAVCAVAIFG